MAGHLFITRSDLTRLSCDAWLLPTSAGFHVVDEWDLSPLHRAAVDELWADPFLAPSGWSRDGVRVCGLEGGCVSDAEPIPVLTNVGRSFQAPTDWYIEGVRQFLDAACGLPRRVRGRERRLVAVPLVGTGFGGLSGRKGSLVDALVPVLAGEAARREVDIALVLRDERGFIAAQNVRRARLGDDAWRELGSDLREQARRLANDAAQGRLVVFAGAGVSAGAGLPAWDDLLADLASQAGLSADERAAIKRFNPLDRANLLRGYCEERGIDLGQAICGRLETRWFSLAHSLLASLPVSEFVTTNYDDLLERASTAAGFDPAVLPYEPVAGRDRWILKLHGSCSRPRDIVLTREDYLRYADRRAALGAIVQALLITRHMLFVGFSLRDDNFHRIVDEVRKALRGDAQSSDDARHGQFGTAFLLRKDHFLERLWADLTLLPFGDGEDLPGPARLLEIFLDLVLAEASRASSPLLDPSYAAVLSEEEQEIADALRALRAGVSPAARATPAWAQIGALLARLGESGHE